MSDCVYQLVDGDRYTCQACGDVRPAPVRRNCPKAPQDTARRLPPILDGLPEESKQLLIGDRIKQLTDALGIPQCGGCEKRQEWLNKAHRWVLGMWG
jgi:hypothetical protein